MLASVTPVTREHRWLFFALCELDPVAAGRLSVRHRRQESVVMSSAGPPSVGVGGTHRDAD